jgi:hypothetical protein
MLDFVCFTSPPLFDRAAALPNRRLRRRSGAKVTTADELTAFAQPLRGLPAIPSPLPAS